MRAIGYTRVSSEDQAESGLSLEDQEKKVRGYAELYELELVDVVVDAGASGKTLERQGLRRVLERLQRGEADAILVAKLDRLTRSVRDLSELLDGYFAEGKWALISVAENVDTRSAIGRLILNILASIAQWEREAIGERTRDALRQKRARGECAGGVPFGFQVGAGGKLVEDLEERAALILMWARRELGQSLGAIARALEIRGYRARGARWHPQSIATILDSARRDGRLRGSIILEGESG